MAYQRKTRDRWDIMTNYGYGWECENSEYTRADARRRIIRPGSAGYIKRSEALGWLINV